jgi:hypothetical protein
MIPAMRTLPSDLCAECRRKIREATKAEKERRRAKARPRVEKENAAGFVEDERYTAAKGAAFKRARDRCEVYVGYFRCAHDGTDPDHVLGGASRKDCERLGSEGLQVMCRGHHDLKTANSPTGRYWLEQAKAHALRIGARRLLPMVERALAKYDAKHGGAHR